jgi:hypothetical protein
VTILKPEVAKFNGETLFLVEGPLSELVASATTGNLLEGLQKRMHRKTTSVEAVAAWVEMQQIVATSASMVFYEGENTHNFAAFLNNRDVVCGTFNGAETLENGENVRLVVSNRSGAMFVHAVYRLKAKVLLMPSTTFNGDHAHFRACMRIGQNIMLGGIALCFGMFALFSVWGDAPLRTDRLFGLSVLFIAIPAAIGFGTEYLTFKSTRSLGLYASAIFKALGIPGADDFSLDGHLRYSRTNVPFGYLIEDALNAHLKRYPNLKNNF